MYKHLNIAIVIPAYNEEKLIGKTIGTVPKSLDYIICVNDASKDATSDRLSEIKKGNERLLVSTNERNVGVGGSLVNGFKLALSETDADVIGVMAGDAQCDPDYIEPMLDVLINGNFDYVKANRFFHRDELKSMPTHRQIGNIFISLLTKFSTGYYSISDTQNGYGFFRRATMDKMNFDIIGKRYDYENTMLIALSIIGAKIKDCPVPAIYGDETSNIKLFPTAIRALRAVWVGFWRRIYLKYVLYSFHPIALFLFSGILLGLFGFGFAAYIVFAKFTHNASPSSGTVMAAVLPIILGFQLVLSAITTDINNEGKD